MPSYEVLLSYLKSARLTIVGEPEVRLGRPEEPIASDPELVKTSFEDSQVMYWEPAKYGARLRAKKTDQNPLSFQGQHGRRSRRVLGALRQAPRSGFDYAFLLTQWKIAR
jgi:hypothetical protein